MKTLALVSFLFFSFATSAQEPSIQWQHCYGGTLGDIAQNIQPTSDGGFIVAGSTASNDGDVSGNHGSSDVWVIKLDSAGNLQWQKCLGGSQSDGALSILEYPTGGYVFAASAASSNDGDISGSIGINDFWIVRLDQGGNLMWQKVLGGFKSDGVKSIRITPDNGFIMAGTTESNSVNVSGNHGKQDWWVVKLDSSGNLMWQKCLGGTKHDYANEICTTSDHGYVVTGWTRSHDGDVIGFGGYYDLWVVKLDSVGNLLWQNCLGGTSFEEGISVCETADSGIAVAGRDGPIDLLIIRFDQSGNQLWDQTYGGTQFEIANCIRPTADGGFVVAGSTSSNDLDVSGNHGSDDVWVVKLDYAGNLMWQKCLGGSSWDIGESICEAPDGGFVVAGYTSSADGNVSGLHGGNDLWVVKIGACANCPVPANPSSEVLANTSVKLNWDIENCAIGYQIKYKATSASSWSTKNVNNNGGAKKLTGLLPNTTYQWGVKSKCSENPITYSTFTPLQTFTTPLRLSNETEEIETTVSISPNPFTTTATITINQPGRFDFMLYDVYGRAVLKSEILNQKSQIERNNLPAGVYFYKVVENEKMISSGKVVME